MKFPKVNGVYPSYCCQHCGEAIGWLGRFMEYLFGTNHECRTKDVK